MKQKPKFTIDNLKAHSSSIRADIQPTLRDKIDYFDKCLADFSQFLKDLEAEPATLQKNVKLMLTCKFLNHIYSAFILAENGLIVDSILCARNALETIAFHWLVCLDPNAIEEYNHGSIPRPVQVRQRLEDLGIDITSIRDLYSSYSEISHVGRNSEKFQSQWPTISDGILHLGGNYLPKDQGELFSFFPTLIRIFEAPLEQK